MMLHNRFLMFLACMGFLAMPSLAIAVDIPLLNPSFDEGNLNMYWGILLTDGSSQTIPGWTYVPNQGNGTNWAVELPNVNPMVPAMGNCNGPNWLTLPMYNGGGAFYQDVASSIVFEASKTYTITTALLARSDAPANPDDFILARLFYRPVVGDYNQSELVADIWLTYSQLAVNNFTDFSVSVTPQAGDACIGKTMGIVFYNGAWATYNGSYYGVDNVRLSVVPEPASIVLAVTAISGLAFYAWRKRK
jgi:hypothetical protein